MNYTDEQKGEIEALESIYEGDFEIVSEKPASFTIPVKTEEFDPDVDSEDLSDAKGLFVLLKFTYTPKYPEEALIVELTEPRFLSDDKLEDLTQHLNEQMQENLGMVMVFTLVSAAIEWLGSTWEKLQTDMAEEAKRLKDLQEDEEKKKFEGTKVTIESFLAWKKTFDEEREASKKLSAKAAAAAKQNKLTGRELFLKDASLNESDVKFAEEGDAVVVDESLFEELDGLDIEDDDDDPDYRPGDDLSD